MNFRLADGAAMTTCRFVAVFRERVLTKAKGSIGEKANAADNVCRLNNHTGSNPVSNTQRLAQMGRASD